MKNTIVCQNCKAENPYFKYICKQCESYLQDRIFNIDLWQILGKLIESPVEGFRVIVRAEHKNFILLITVLASVKILIDAMFISVFVSKNENAYHNFYIHLLFAAGLFILFVLIFSILLFFINKMFGITTRIRDNYSIFTYSFFPYVFGLILLFPIELILFGSYLFSFNPSPFIIKGSLAYALTAFEALVLLWSLVLSIFAMYAQTKSVIYAATTAIIFNGSLYFLIYFAATKFLI